MARALTTKRLDQIASQINELGLSAVLGQKLSAETAEAKRNGSTGRRFHDDGDRAKYAGHD